MDFSLFMVPGFLVLSIFFGIPVALLTPYGILMGSWLFLLLGYGFFLYRRKHFIDAMKLFLTAMAGYWFFFIALLFSKKQLEAPIDVHGVFARAGFPFRVLDIPVPPMGNGLPPVSAWLGMWGNVTIWIAVAAALIFGCYRFLYLEHPKKATFILVALVATVPLLFSNALIVLWFD